MNEEMKQIRMTPQRHSTQADVMLYVLFIDAAKPPAGQRRFAPIMILRSR